MLKNYSLKFENFFCEWRILMKQKKKFFRTPIRKHMLYRNGVRQLKTRPKNECGENEKCWDEWGKM